MALMINIDYTALNLALVTITDELNSTLTIMQWVLGAYMLIWAAIVLPVGRAADYFGQKHFCLIGLAIFTIGSLLAGIANSSTVLIAARVLQGVSGAFYVPAIYALIFTNYPEHKRGLAMGFMSLGVGLGMAIGPTFGGAILTALGWRYIFLVNIPISVIAFLVIYFFAKSETINNNNRFEINKLSSFLLGLALICFMTSLGGIHQWGGLTSPIFIGLILISIILFIGFLLHQKHDKQALVPASLFKNKSYLACLIAIVFEQFSFTSCIVILALYFQFELNFSVIKSSLVFLGLNIVFGIIAPCGGVLVDKVGLRKPALIGVMFFAIGMFMTTQLGSTVSLSLLLSALIVIGIGMGLAFAALNSGVVKTVSADEINIASSVFILFALIGNTLGVVICTALYEYFSSGNHSHITGVHAAMYATVIALVLSWLSLYKLMDKKL